MRSRHAPLGDRSVPGRRRRRLWALALVPGLLLGTWVASRLGEADGAGLFDLPVPISTVNYIGTSFGILAVVLLALVLPLRRVARLDLAASTKTLA